MVGVAQVALVGQPSYRRPADQHVGPVAANLAGYIPPQLQGGFEHGVFVSQEHHVSQAEHLARV